MEEICDEKTFQKFGLSSHFGFLPNIVACLPEYFARWELLVNEMPHLLCAQNGKEFQTKIRNLPLLDAHILNGYNEMGRALSILAFLVHGYVYADLEHPIALIPSTISIPFTIIAKKLGTKPIQTEVSLMLFNWKLIDPLKPLSKGNLTVLQTFLGGMDETIFYTNMVEIEAQSIYLIKIIFSLIAAIKSDDSKIVIDILNIINSVIKRIIDFLMEIEKGCDPYVFFKRVRPYLAGWANNKLFPHGVHYEGVDNVEHHLYGGSAAQSPTIQLIDTILGIDQSNNPYDSSHFIQHMNSYLLTTHRDFIAQVRFALDLRDYAKSKKNRKVTETYNNCILSLLELRRSHNYIVQQYVIAQGSEIGTAGTHIMQFLKGIQQYTHEHVIKDHSRL